MKINWNEKQLNILKKIDFDFNVSSDLSDNKILEIDEKLTDYFQMNCIENDKVIGEGFICESIFDAIAELD